MLEKAAIIIVSSQLLRNKILRKRKFDTEERMINKDDELLIIGIINEDTIEGNIPLKEVRSVFFDLI